MLSLSLSWRSSAPWRFDLVLVERLHMRGLGSTLRHPTRVQGEQRIAAHGGGCDWCLGARTSLRTVQCAAQSAVTDLSIHKGN
jgi:hypothetical protein